MLIVQFAQSLVDEIYFIQFWNLFSKKIQNFPLMDKT